MAESRPETGWKAFRLRLCEGNQLDWHLQDEDGFTVANGVYLYVVAIKGYDGTEILSEVRKLVVLR